MKITYNEIKVALQKINKKIADSPLIPFPKKSRNWELEIIDDNVHLVVKCTYQGQEILFTESLKRKD